MRVVCELEQDLVRQSAGRHEDANEGANSRTHTLPSEGAPEVRYCLPDQVSVIVERDLHNIRAGGFACGRREPGEDRTAGESSADAGMFIIYWQRQQWIATTAHRRLAVVNHADSEALGNTESRSTNESVGTGFS